MNTRYDDDILNFDTQDDIRLLEANERVIEPAPLGRLERLKRMAVRIGSGIKATLVTGYEVIKGGAVYVIRNPLSSGIALVAALPNSLSALVAPSGASPSQLGAEWWNKMSYLRRIYSIASAFSSLSINTIMNALFIPQTGQKLKASLAEMRQGAGKITLNLVSIFLALGGGIAQGAIALESFAWLPFARLTSIPFALIAFLVTFSSRYPSIINIFNRLGNLLRADARLQQAYAEKIDLISQEYLAEMEGELQTLIQQLFYDSDHGKPLNDENMQKLIRAFSIRFEELQRLHPDLIRTQSRKEYIAKYVGLMMDLILVILCTIPGYMTFTQKGFDGINAFAKMAQHPLDDLHAGWRGLIGSAPGLASFMFYGNGCIDLRTTLVSLVSYLYANPSSIAAAMTILVMTGIGSNSMNGIGQGIVKNTNNIFGLKNNAAGSTYVALITLAGASANANSALTKYLSKPAPTLSEIKIKHLSHYLSHPNDHCLSSETTHTLRAKNGYTAPPQNEPLEPPPHTSVQVAHRPLNLPSWASDTLA